MKLLEKVEQIHIKLCMEVIEEKKEQKKGSPNRRGKNNKKEKEPLENKIVEIPQIIEGKAISVR